MSHNNLYKIWLVINRVSIVKTLYYNFKLLPFKQAKKLPLLIGKNTIVRSTKGVLKIDGHVKTGMISFGVLLIFRDDIRKRNYIDISGEVIFKGHAIFHTGTILKSSKGSKIIFGDNFKLGADSVIYSEKSISFGEMVEMSWNVQILDTDFHFIEKIDTKESFPRTKPISIGNNVWIGNGVCINKGTIIPNGCIVASRSMVNKSFDKQYCILAGTPAKVVKEGFTRVFDFEEESRLAKQFQ